MRSVVVENEESQMGLYEGSDKAVADGRTGLASMLGEGHMG